MGYTHNLGVFLSFFIFFSSVVEYFVVFFVDFCLYPLRINSVVGNVTVLCMYLTRSSCGGGTCGFFVAGSGTLGQARDAGKRQGALPVSCLLYPVSFASWRLSPACAISDR